MLRISNIKVYELEESVIACRNAMRTELPEYSMEEFDKSFERAVKLVQASKNSNVKCHDNFLTGIRVSFDIIYPQYWTPEFQRYHFADIVTSASKMHKLLKMNFNSCCNKYVGQTIIDKMNCLIDIYNTILNNDYPEGHLFYLKLRDGSRIETFDKQEALYYQWMVILSNCPLGLELFMRVSTNYKQLQTIYHQRKNHKLKEDWGAFCKMIEDLPYFDNFIK